MSAIVCVAAAYLLHVSAAYRHLLFATPPPSCSQCFLSSAATKPWLILRYTISGISVIPHKVSHITNHPTDSVYSQRIRRFPFPRIGAFQFVPVALIIIINTNAIIPSTSLANPTSLRPITPPGSAHPARKKRSRNTTRVELFFTSLRSTLSTFTTPTSMIA